MEENTELPVEPTEEQAPAPEKTLLQILLDLKDEAKTIRALDLSLVDSLKDEIATASTLKRLSRLPDIDTKFSECFAILEDIVCSIDDRARFNTVLKDVTSNFEVDILAILMASVSKSDDK